MGKLGAEKEICSGTALNHFKYPRILAQRFKVWKLEESSRSESKRHCDIQDGMV